MKRYRQLAPSLSPHWLSWQRRQTCLETLSPTWSSLSWWVSAATSRADSVKWARLWITEQASRARSGQSCSIWLGPLVWSCFAALPFIHPAALTVFDHASVKASLLSSLGSCSCDGSGLCWLLMTALAGLMALIRWGIFRMQLFALLIFVVVVVVWDINRGGYLVL